MKKKNSVMGITAAAPKPDWRGFLILALLIGLPVAFLAEMIW